MKRSYIADAGLWVRVELSIFYHSRLQCIIIRTVFTGMENQTWILMLNHSYLWLFNPPWWHFICPCESLRLIEIFVWCSTSSGGRMSSEDKGRNCRPNYFRPGKTLARRPIKPWPCVNVLYLLYPFLPRTSTPLLRFVQPPMPKFPLSRSSAMEGEQAHTHVGDAITLRIASCLNNYEYVAFICFSCPEAGVLRELGPAIASESTWWAPANCLVVV